MRFNTKRALSLLVAVCMLVAMLPASLISASAAEVGTVYSYKFHEAVKATSGGAQYDPKTKGGFATDYTASQNANVGSAPWKIVAATGCTYSGSSADIYGLFGFGTKGGTDTIKYQINVPEDGEYKATMNFYQYGSSTPVDVYLNKVDSAENFLMNIDKTDATEVRAVSAENVMLTAGDYYLTLKQLGGGDVNNRYFTHYSFDLELTAAFDANAITAVEFDKSNVILGMDGMDFLTPSVLPESADTGDVVYTWESSDENVVIVDEGLLMPIGPGFATVTATTENGKFATAYVYVTDEVNFEYNFTKGFRGSSSTNAVDIAGMGYQQTMAGSPSEVACSNGYIATAPWAFEKFLSAGTSAAVTSSFPIGGAQTTTDCRGYVIVAKDNGGVSFRISVPTGGTYTMAADITKGNGYGSGTFYLAPADAVNPTADDYAISDEVSFQSAALADHSIVTFGDKELDAGEYIVSVKGVINALFWRTFTLTNPDLVKEVNFTRDSLNVAVGETASVAAIVTPDSALNKTLTFSSNNPDVAVVDEATGAVMGISKGTATITATAVSNTTKTDSITINVGDKIFYYDFMKSNGFGLTPGRGDDKYLKDTAYSQDFKYTKSGSADEVGVDYESYGWKIGATSNSSDWTWSQSAQALGLYNCVNNAGADLGYAQIHIDVPLAGTYDVISVHSLWTGGTTLDYYIAPADAVDPMAASYKVNAEPVNHKTDNGTNYTVEAVVGTITLAAGENIITFANPSVASGAFIRGIRLAASDLVVPVEGVTLDKSGTVEIPYGESITATATVLPANASNKTLTWTSSDDSIATVVDGVVTAVGKGFAEITATTTDGTEIAASFKVMCGLTLAYTYDIRGDVAPLYNPSNKDNVHVADTDFAVSYDAAIAAGSAPWMFVDSTNYNKYFDYTSSSYGGFGLFGMNSTVVGTWSRIQINVAEDAKYVGAMGISDWAQSNSFDIYVAPVSAADPLAEKYNVASYVPSGNTAHGVKLMMSEMNLAAGDYYVTFINTDIPAGGAGLIGLFALELYACGEYEEVLPEVGLTTINGAQIRTSGTQGLRFISTIDKTSADYNRVVEFGHIMIPEASLEGDYSRLVLDGVMPNGHKVGKSQALNLYADDEASSTFTTVITTSNVKNYVREYAVRAYAILDDGSVVYGEQITVRSIYGVAERGLENENTPDWEKAIYQDIMDAVANL